MSGITNGNRKNRFALLKVSTIIKTEKRKNVRRVLAIVLWSELFLDRIRKCSANKRIIMMKLEYTTG